MRFKINALKNDGSEPLELELLDNSFETKELALQYVKDNIVLDESIYDRDVVVLISNGNKYHYFEVIDLDFI